MIMETIPQNQAVIKLRNVITTAQFLKQAQGFKLITQEDHQKYIKELNDKTHVVVDEIIATIDK